MNPRLPGSKRLFISRELIKKYVLEFSHRRIVKKITNRRFSYSCDLRFSSFTVFFATLPHQSEIFYFLFFQLIVEMQKRKLLHVYKSK